MSGASKGVPGSNSGYSTYGQVYGSSHHHLQVGNTLSPHLQSKTNLMLHMDSNKKSEVNAAITNALQTDVFIESQADYLERLRSQCSTSAQLTQQEIRSLEGKLVKSFSLQLVAKKQLQDDDNVPEELQHFPSLSKWLQVVGLRKESVQNVCKMVPNLECLLEKKEQDLLQYGTPFYEAQKLSRAIDILRKYTEIQMQGDCNDSNEDSLPLYWDSWENRYWTADEEPENVNTAISEESTPTQRTMDGHLTPSSPLPTIQNFPLLSPGGSHSHSVSSSSIHLPNPNMAVHEKRHTPPPTPPIKIKTSSGDKKVPSTPPPCKKHQLINNTYLNRSTSHDSQLYSHVESSQEPSTIISFAATQLTNLSNQIMSGRKLTNLRLGGSVDRLSGRSNRTGSEREGQELYTATPPEGRTTLSRRDLRNEDRKRNHRDLSVMSGPASPSGGIPREDEREENYLNRTTLPVPKSPRTPTLAGAMVFNIQHRFTKTLKSSTCGYCSQKFPMLSGGLKCKECNLKCHRECVNKVPHTCGLPIQYLEFFTERFKQVHGEGAFGNSSPSHNLSEVKNYLFSSTSQPQINYPGPDSGSNTSSCTSSTPSSPAQIASSPARHDQFHYPDMKRSEDLDRRIWNFTPPRTSHLTSSFNSWQGDVIDTRQSRDSDLTITTTSGSGSTGTDESERTVAERFNSQDSTDGDGWESGCCRQNSVGSVTQSLREWDIPYDELARGEIIGRGRFGTVYSGNWHGQVAIKELRMDYCNDEKTLEAFKAEVSTFRKTRHENLVLFMGACMKPPRLAIVTSLCKGMTLYRQIHDLKKKFTMSRTILIAQQITQGMGYLHARGIVHKDLKTKNIFVDNLKVVITDFGLFNVTRLCQQNSRRGDWLSIPPGWLCYLAPEIMRVLTSSQDELLPFSPASDVYSFGTVWFELLCCEWPYKELSPEAVIWQVGRGMKPSLAHLQASKDVKDILMACWSYSQDDRPEFSSLLTLLTKLPKKRLERSPSHPVHLSRSAESVF